MNFRPTVLNIYAILFLLGCIAFTIYNYEELSREEGWGLVGMVALFVVGLGLLVVDLIIRNLVKNRVLVNWIGLGVAVIVTLALLFGEDF